SRAPRGDDDASPCINQADVHGGDNRSGIIANDGVARDGVTAALEKLADRLSAGVVVFGAGVADREDETSNGNRRVRFVLLNAHAPIIWGSRLRALGSGLSAKRLNP